MNWIVMPCRNGRELTRRCLHTLLAQDIGDVSVLVVDTGSEDGTRELARTYENVSLIRMQDASVSECWNTALSWVFMTVPYALVVNNDTELRPDTYRLLCEDRGAFVTAVGTDNLEKINGPLNGHFTKRPHPYFSCFLIRRECWQKVGPFDEAFKGAYCEDGDYHLRMHKAGIYAYCIDLPFYHVGSGTLKNADGEDKERICKMADANRDYFQRKWGFAMGSPEYYAVFGTTADLPSVESPQP